MGIGQMEKNFIYLLLLLYPFNILKEKRKSYRDFHRNTNLDLITLKLFDVIQNIKELI